MKEDLQKVVKYFINNWLIEVVVAFVLAFCFQDLTMAGWFLLGTLLGKTWRS